VGEYRKRAGIAIFGLIGIAVPAAIGYVLIAVWSANERDSGTAAQIPADTGLASASNATLAVDADSTGITVYKRTCAACHGSGAANAPRLGDQAAWEPRMAQGIDRLLATSISGKGAMPPRGTCADCSDKDLKAAIDYMLVQAGYQPAASPGATE